jgi:hypothetical protein
LRAREVRRAVVAPQDLAQALCRAPDKGVARSVPEGLVNTTEVVEVDAQQRDRRTRAVRFLRRLPQAGEESCAPA